MSKTWAWNWEFETSLKPMVVSNPAKQKTYKFARPLAQGVLDLVFAFLGRYSIPPRAKRAPPWGGPPRKYPR